jgi:hypothetical protein
MSLAATGRGADVVHPFGQPIRILVPGRNSLAGPGSRFRRPRRAPLAVAARRHQGRDRAVLEPPQTVFARSSEAEGQPAGLDRQAGPVPVDQADQLVAAGRQRRETHVVGGAVEAGDALVLARVDGQNGGGGQGSKPLWRRVDRGW